MKRFRLSLLLTVLLGMVCVTSFAHNYEVDGTYYTYNSGSVEIPDADLVDSEGFKYINEFTYVKDISDYSGTNPDWYSFVNCSQHADGNVIKANVFCVEQFYGRSEGQSYARLLMYGDKDANDKIGEFDFCWGWYSLYFFKANDDFNFVDAYDNMEVGESKQFNSDGIVYTLTLLDKIISNSNNEKKIVFSFDRPIYFGGDYNGYVGIERFSNRVQIKYLKDINQNEGQTQQDDLVTSEVLINSYSQEVNNQGNDIFYLPGNKTAFDGRMVCGIEQTELKWSGYRYYSTFKYSLIPLDKAGMVSFIYSNDKKDVGEVIDGKKIIAKSKYFNLPYAPSASSAASQTDVFYFFTPEGSVAIVEDYHQTSPPGQTSTYSWNPEEHRPEGSYSYCYAVILDEENTIETGNYEHVDLGLPSGIKWANMNVGAISVEDAGQKFAWGETTTKEEYLEENYLWGTSIYDITKYNINDGLTFLLPEDDAATVNMGAEWRTPTVEEWYELKNNCTRQWTRSNGVYGYRFTGNNGNSIFLPVWIETSWMGGAGAYWTSTLGDVDYAAYDIDFDGGGFYIDCSYSPYDSHSSVVRSFARNIRAVYDPRESIIEPSSLRITMATSSGAPRTMIGYSSKYGLDFTGIDDVRAYIVMGYKKGMTDVLAVRVDVVPPYTGIVIKTDNPGVVVDVPTTTEMWNYANMLKPVVESQTIYPTETIDGEQYTNFMVGTLTNGEMGFVAPKNSTVRQNKSYLPVLSSFYESSAGARQAGGFGIEFVDGESTDISSLLYDSQLPDGSYYDLQGRKVKPVGKGLYIHNGKKVYVK